MNTNQFDFCLVAVFPGCISTWNTLGTDKGCVQEGHWQESQVHVNGFRASRLEPGHKWCAENLNQKYVNFCVTEPPWVNQGTVFSSLCTTQCCLNSLVHIQIIVWFLFFSSLKETVAGWKQNKQTSDVLITYFPFAYAASFQYPQFKGGPKHVTSQAYLLSLRKTATALPKSALYTHWKSGPQFAKMGQAFFSRLSLSPLLKAIYLNCMVSFSLQLSGIFHKISSLITILLLFLLVFWGCDEMIVSRCRFIQVWKAQLVGGNWKG